MSSGFLIGVAVGLCIGILLQWLSLRSKDSYLVRKSEPGHRTPICVRGRFLYIMPESEYVHDYLQLRRVADSFNRAEIGFPD